MPTNEEGEFELILGNRQLLSVFFIVVILLGIFFTMGYIVGQHSTPLVTADANAGKNSKPIVVDSARETPPETAREAPEPESAKPPAKTPEPPPPTPVKTAPQQPAEAPAAAPKPEPAKATPSKAAKSEKSAERKAAETPRQASPGTLSGTYLQLAATTKREADIMVDVLRQKKFSAVTAAIPEKPDLFRVLVGPIAESQVNKTKTDLQSAGFPGDKSIKRNF